MVEGENNQFVSAHAVASLVIISRVCVSCLCALAHVCLFMAGIDWCTGVAASVVNADEVVSEQRLHTSIPNVSLWIRAAGGAAVDTIGG